jgi:lipid-A-disaccharide synthase-like uncharacterized protein
MGDFHHGKVLAHMRRRPIKTGWRLLVTVGLLVFPLLYVVIWVEASRFSRRIWQVSPLLVLKWSVLALVVMLVTIFVEKRGRD